MKEELAQKILEARRSLILKGVRDTMDNVLEITGGSKSTLKKYWSSTYPADHPMPPLAAPPASPVVTEAAFRQSFDAYVQASQRFLATQGIVGNEALTLQLGRRVPHLPTRKTEYALPRWHPLVEELEDDLAEAYVTHLDVWKQIREQQAPTPAPVQFEEPEPEPEPELSIENLRAYYTNRSTSPWPGGLPRVLPLEEVYGVLTTLRKEWDNELVAADRARYVVVNTLGQQPSGRADAPSLRQAEDRCSAARLRIHEIDADRDRVRHRAHDEGIAL